MKAEVIRLLTTYWPVILTSLVAFYQWVTRDLALAISMADKNNDGQLTNEELEDLAVLLVQGAKNPALRALPEALVRILIRWLCNGRRQLLNLNAGQSTTDRNPNDLG
jgi:hypothetical protein